MIIFPVQPQPIKLRTASLKKTKNQSCRTNYELTYSTLIQVKSTILLQKHCSLQIVITTLHQILSQWSNQRDDTDRTVACMEVMRNV